MNTSILDYKIILEQVLSEKSASNYVAAVAIIRYRDKYLLGLSNANDDRRMKWCFPGGHLKRGETPHRAAVREAKEETGIKCKAVGDVINLKSKPKVAFIKCVSATISQPLKKNHEFVALGWFRESDLRNIKLYKNVKELIALAKE